MRIRFRSGDRCGRCGTQWSSGWFRPRTGPGADLPLCADCNCLRSTRRRTPQLRRLPPVHRGLGAAA